MSTPHEPDVHRTERTAAAKLAEQINQVIAEANLPLGAAEVETGGEDTKFPDIVLYAAPGSSKVLVVIEAKPPAFLNALDEDELKEPARRKATNRGAPYFCTTNFKDLWCFITEQVNKAAPEPKQILNHYTLSALEDLDRFDDPGVRSSICHAMQRFLADLHEVVVGRKALPLLAVDELLVLRVQATIHNLARHYRGIIEKKANTDGAFVKELARWFTDQGWSFASQSDDFDKAARQTAYLLVNKIVFYNAIQPVRRLVRLEIPDSLTRGSDLQKFLQTYFQMVLDIDYATIYSADFIDQLAFPDSAEVVDEVKELIGVITRYDFSNLGYEVIGRIFERMIPHDERHVLGQYFTDPDVVDLILRFCLKNEKDKVLDPSCGAGTFLVRAYQHKKLMNQRLSHGEIIDTLWGNDIAKFPAHLCTINLAINDLHSEENFPNVVQNDFFDMTPESDFYRTRGAARKVKVKGLGTKDRTVQHPRYFDCIVGNPPYTRHHEIEEMQGSKSGYKSRLIEKAAAGLDKMPSAGLSRRAGIYSYFFLHGTKFLQDGSRFGFIVSNSWLDADYGTGLQEHLLDNYKIVAIIESKVERWFADAEINTCIVILEKASGEKNKPERDNNYVRFAYLLKPLRHFVPPAESLWAKQVSRLDAIDKLIKTILFHKTYYENDELRIYPKRQCELWEEGWDEQRRKYALGKWGKYIRAPKIFFTIMERDKDKLAPMAQLATVNEGKPTGADTFFFMPKAVAETLRIEERFLKPGLLKPRGVHSLELHDDDVDTLFFAAPADRRILKGTAALKYIQMGERRGLKDKASFANKAQWYAFSARPPAHLFLSRGMPERIHCIRNHARIVTSGSFTEIRVKDQEHTEALWAFLNCAVGWLFIELHGRSNLGGGLLKVEPTDLRKMPVPLPGTIKGSISAAMAPLLKRPVGTVEEESRQADRKALDDLIMGEALGLTEAEQREVYDAVIDLVRTRHSRARSVSGGGAPGGKLSIAPLVEMINTRLKGAGIGEFYRTHILPLPGADMELPAFRSAPEVQNTLYCWILKSGKIEVQCRSEAEARFLKILADMGFERAHIPADDEALERLTAELQNVYRSTLEATDEVSSGIVQRTLQETVVRHYWAAQRQVAFGVAEDEAEYQDAAAPKPERT